MSFPRYAERRDSAVEWLGVVPAHWNVVPIKQLGRLKGGAGFPHDAQGVQGEELHFHKVNALSRAAPDGKLQPGDNTVSRDAAIRLGAFVFPAGTLVFAKVGAALLLGRVCELKEPACIDNNMMGLIIDGSRWEIGFVRYAMALVRFDLIANPGAVPSLNEGQIGGFTLAIPDRREQAAITAFLDRETAKIDALVEEQKRLIELLKEKRRAVISQAVTKGLDPSVPMKDSGVEWLGEVPAHWELGGLTRFIGPVVDYRGRTPTKTDEGIFLVTARNIRNGKIDYEASQEYVDPQSAGSLLERGRPEMGDLLFTMEAPLGQVALIDRIDIALAQRIVKFRGKSDVLSSNFLLYWFIGDYCQARLITLATGSTALGIKASKLGMIECLVPPIDEQAAIVGFLERETAKVDSLIIEAESATALLHERRSGLISAAVTGKIDVRGLVGQPEPAAA